MHGADMGNVQLYDPQAQTLAIVAQRGFRQDFLDFFHTVSADDDTSCGRAVRSGGRAVIEDVQADPAYAPYRQVAAAAGYRAVQSTPLRSRRGELLGVLSTHFRRAHRPSERDLRMLDLYARQASDLIERLRAEEALKDADRRKDEWLAMLAHELRNPLAPIGNAVQFLRLEGPTDPDLQNARDIIERQLRQMTRLVDDLLDVSRITRGKLTLRQEPVSLGAVLTNAVESSRPLIEAAGHDLAVSLPPEPILVEADPTRLAQAFLNLLNNAAKYTPQGGRIGLSAERQGGVAVVRVRDTGIGIPALMLPHIFDLFTQVDRSLERSQGGLGIGLTLVKRLVEMHGGGVEARSEGPDQGSEFVVRLPVIVMPAVPSPQPSLGGERAAVAAKLRILLVDDNRDAAESLGLLFQVKGHDVRIAHDGVAGLEAAASFRPDVALLDIGMPRLNGYDLARRLRGQAWGQGLVLIALTGWGQEDDRRRTQEAGFDHHLVKPVDPDALQELLARTTLVGQKAS
jgi:signal transduction histidine kinase/ActR/RegA family two-component response regulator